MDYLPCIEEETQTPVDASVIWLHGLGADGNDFLPVMSELALPTSAAVRFIFPTAPKIPITVNDGLVMPAWYDLLHSKVDYQVDEKRLISSALRIQALMDREIDRGVDSKRIVLSGFSQGGAVAYHAAITYGRPLAGVLALSTYLATSKQLQSADITHTFPIQIYHGTQDPIVPETLAETARQTLKSWGFTVGYHTYPMVHSICPQEIRAISIWLQNALQIKTDNK